MKDDFRNRNKETEEKEKKVEIQLARTAKLASYLAVKKTKKSENLCHGTTILRLDISLAAHWDFHAFL